MESLVANYGSSDEEDGGRGRDEKKRRFPPPRPPPTSSYKSSPAASSFFNTLPRPKISPSSSSIFSSLPPPKSSAALSSAPSSSSSSFFSSLPLPKSQPQKPSPQATKSDQFRPRNEFSLLKSVDGEEDEDEIKEKRRKQTLDFSSKPLSSIIPAPKNTLGLAPSSSGSLRRSIIETASPANNTAPPAPDRETARVPEDAQGNYEAQWMGDSPAPWPSTEGNYDVREGSCGNHIGDWGYGSAAAEGAIAALGRRGRKEIPTEIVEVKQEELVKNRPREDQVKLTGIAFGPAYQPAAASGKGKPSKLHKRKHQIGALYYDMRQKETELAERRAKGFLTKKETQAKYGW